MTDAKQVLALAVAMGETLLNNGAEIYRVQDTMLHVAAAFGQPQMQVYVLTNGLFASLDSADGVNTGEVRHVPQATVHLGRVAAVNALSRDISAGKVTVQQAMQQLNEIRRLHYARPASLIVACGVGAGCFSYLFGGTEMDALAAFVAGLALEVLLLYGLSHVNGKILKNILAAGFVTLCSMGAVLVLQVFGVSANLDKIIIGGIIPLLPGMALTISFRDFAGGDYLSGTIRLIDALLVGGSIAMGVGVVLKVAALLSIAGVQIG